MYFLDTGLACYLANIDTPQALEASYLSGAILETYALCEILKSFWHNGEETRNLYFYRDSNKKEIDFLLEKNLTLYPIEIKKTASPDSGDCSNFGIIENSGKTTVGQGAIICLCDNLLPIPKKKVTAIPVWEI